MGGAVISPVFQGRSQVPVGGNLTAAQLILGSKLLSYCKSNHSHYYESCHPLVVMGHSCQCFGYLVPLSFF
jgi:hypothetical protein